MSLDKKRRLMFWRRVKQADVPKKYNTAKIRRVMKILQKDAHLLGIDNVALAVESDNSSFYSAMSGLDGEKPISIPNTVNIDYDKLENLSLDEIRSVLWHELGHFILPVYYPDLDKKYEDKKAPGAYYVVQSFCDELAYKKFGKTYFVAFAKLEKMEPANQKFKEDFERLFPMMEYVDKHGYGYWKELAKKYNIELKKINRASVPGVKPNVALLDGLI